MAAYWPDDLPEGLGFWLSAGRSGVWYWELDCGV